LQPFSAICSSDINGRDSNRSIAFHSPSGQNITPKYLLRGFASTCLRATLLLSKKCLILYLRYLRGHSYLDGMDTHIFACDSHQGVQYITQSQHTFQTVILAYPGDQQRQIRTAGLNQRSIFWTYTFDLNPKGYFISSFTRAKNFWHCHLSRYRTTPYVIGLMMPMRKTDQKAKRALKLGYGSGTMVVCISGAFHLYQWLCMRHYLHDRIDGE
jgi:hypothetical protein